MSLLIRLEIDVTSERIFVLPTNKAKYDPSFTRSVPWSIIENMLDQVLREQLVKFLQGNEAHMSFLDMIKDFPEEHMNDIFPNGEYTFWHLLEHIRFTQKDILDFMVDPEYKEPEWPKDYWPERKAKATKNEWEKTISEFEKDLKSLIELVQDPKIDLEAKVPNGTGQIYLREFLLVIDHNSYHIGEFAIMRQVNNNWH